MISADFVFFFLAYYLDYHTRSLLDTDILDIVSVVLKEDF